MSQPTYRLRSFAHQLWIAALILLLAARCTPAIGGAIGGEGPSGATSATLEGATWTLVSFTAAEGPLPIPETLTPTLRFEDGSYAFDAGCNAVVGEYKLQDDIPRIINIAMHSINCSSDTGGTEAMALEYALADSIVSWSDYRMVDDELHIDYEGGELVFTRASSE